MAQATAPILDSTEAANLGRPLYGRFRGDVARTARFSRDGPTTEVEAAAAVETIVAIFVTGERANRCLAAATPRPPDLPVQSSGLPRREFVE
jgi:hypothetical protein